ncbi:MAG TPA: hypothetical protein VK157_14955 [Phycisphaerales bacterium]|nr:hypothetical protein [Phycisphaerales bacterium]
MIAKWLSACDRLQQSRWFKIVASVIVVAIAAVLFISYSVASAKARDAAMAPVREAQADLRKQAEEVEAAAKAQGTTLSSEELNRPLDTMDATARVVEGIVSAQHSVAGVGAGLAIITAVALVVIWLGLGITYFALIAACAIVLGSVWGLERLGAIRGVLPIIMPPLVGVVGLMASFTALMRLGALLLSASNPVFSIARNVLTEAVRLRVSLVFIILLMFSLAALPLLLTQDQPLRYRVQAFLQYATGGSFLLIALLIVLFSVATVATEQRDKIIWQTVTKPVAAWQYLLGKWIGVGTLAAVLLAVSSSGIFIFTEFLRRQPAQGESSAFVASDTTQMMSEDRLMLETQVLTSKTRVGLSRPDIDFEALDREIENRVKTEFDNLQQPLGTTPEQVAANREKLANEIREGLLKSVDEEYRTIAPGGNQRFWFSGLQRARDSASPVILRYKVQSGGNMPDQMYRVTFAFPGGNDPPAVVETPLDQPQTMRLSHRLIDAEGNLVVDIINGDIERGTPNPLSITFPPEDGFELSYVSGSFTANYFRLMTVLWVKLLFLAMVGITASTFMSFPVATLVAIVTFWAAEGSNFLLKSLESFETQTQDGKTLWINMGIGKIAEGIGYTFKIYADLRPTSRLVEGESLPWSTLLFGTVVLLLVTAILYVIGVYIFRKRELAIYSGH